MTAEETRLWCEVLKCAPFSVRRQKVIGKYIVDFYCPKQKIAIEIDGSQHYETDGITKDNLRDKYLNSLGIEVLRYTNKDINMHLDSVYADIMEHIDEKNKRL